MINTNSVQFITISGTLPHAVVDTNTSSCTAPHDVDHHVLIQGRQRQSSLCHAPQLHIAKYRVPFSVCVRREKSSWHTVSLTLGSREKQCFMCSSWLENCCVNTTVDDESPQQQFSFTFSLTGITEVYLTIGSTNANTTVLVVWNSVIKAWTVTLFRSTVLSTDRYDNNKAPCLLWF